LTVRPHLPNQRKEPMIVPSWLEEAQKIQGWMTEGELKWLYDRAAASSHVVEIGCWKGRSTYALLSACKGPVYAVDTFSGSINELGPGMAHHEALENNILDQFWKNVGHFPNLRVIQAFSRDAAKMFDDFSIDMIFIDADHSYEACSEDIRLWLPKCRKLLCGHDYQNPSVKRACEEQLKEHQRMEEHYLWSYQKVRTF